MVEVAAYTGLVVTLLDQDGAVLFTTETAPGETAVLEYTALSDGYCYVTVQGSQPALLFYAYTLDLALADTDDHGDGFLTATSLEVDAEPVAGVLESGDVDVFAFTGVAGVAYTVQTTGDVDTYMELYYRGGATLLAVDDDSGDGANALIAFTAPKDDSYYVVIEGYDPDEDTGDYAVSVASG